MIFYIFTIAVLNFCLGLAAAAHLARRSGGQGAQRPATGFQPSKAPRPPEASVPEAAQLAADEEDTTADENELAAALAGGADPTKS